MSERKKLSTRHVATLIGLAVLSPIVAVSLVAYLVALAARFGWTCGEKTMDWIFG